MFKEDIVYLITFFRNAKESDLRKIFGMVDIHQITKKYDVDEILIMVKDYIRKLYDLRKE